MKALNFYGRFLLSFTAIGYAARGLPVRPVKNRLDGQTWLVTGATGGIGRAIALEAATRGAKVYAVGRRKDALEELSSSCPPRSIMPIVSDLSLVRENLELARNSPHIDVLVNNVGILEPQFKSTSEGYGRMYGTNLLGPYALTRELLLLRKLDRSTIINVASGGLYNLPLNLDHLDADQQTFNAFAAYATQKRSQIELSDMWDRGPNGCRAYTMHPGWVKTAGVASALPRMDRFIGPILRTTKQGADTVLWLAAKQPQTQAGALWFDRKARSAHAYTRTRQPLATPEQLRSRLDEDLKRLEQMA